MRRLWLGLPFVVLAIPAQARVTAAPGARVFRLDGNGVTYALGIDDKGYLRSIH
jgi:alpha-galactosidase